MNYGIKIGKHWYVFKSLSEATKFAELIRKQTKGDIVSITKTTKHVNFEFVAR